MAGVLPQCVQLRGPRKCLPEDKWVSEIGVRLKCSYSIKSTAGVVWMSCGSQEASGRRSGSKKGSPLTPTHTGMRVLLEFTMPLSVMLGQAQNHLNLKRWISFLFVGLDAIQNLNLAGKLNVSSAWVLFQGTVDQPLGSWTLGRSSELSTSFRHSNGAGLQVNTFRDH